MYKSDFLASMLCMHTIKAFFLALKLQSTLRILYRSSNISYYIKVTSLDVLSSPPIRDPLRLLCLFLSLKAMSQRNTGTLWSSRRWRPPKGL